MTKKLLQKKFILDIKEEDLSAADRGSDMEEDSDHTTEIILDDEDEEEEDVFTSGSSSGGPSTSTSSSSRLIHSGSQAPLMEGLHTQPNSKDFLLFRKMTAEAAVAAAAAAASAAVPPIVPLPLRQSDFLLPPSSVASTFHPRFSEEHWKALSSLYSSHYYQSHFPSPSPFLLGSKLSPLFNPAFPRITESRPPLIHSLHSSPFQPPVPPPFNSELWSPLRRKRSPSPTEARRRRFTGEPTPGGSSSSPPPPAMKRYKRERLILPNSCTLSKDQIIHMPIDQFNDYLARSNFSEEELSRLKDARRKGKNRVAARRSRDHRLQEVRCLKTRQERVKKDKVHVFKEYETSIEDCKLWERIHELFTYHISRFVEERTGYKAASGQFAESGDLPPGPSATSIIPTRAFNPPPMVLNSC